MADVVTHGSHGGWYAVLVRLATGGKILPTVIAYVYGFLEGAWPDLKPWIVALWRRRKNPNDPRVGTLKVFSFTVPYCFDVKEKTHAETFRKWYNWLRPAFMFHVRVVDPDFHAAGEDWFPKEWRRYFAFIGLGLLGIFLSFF